jgi:hypothetical protein
MVCDTQKGMHSSDKKLKIYGLVDVIPGHHTLGGDSVCITISGGKENYWQSLATFPKIHTKIEASVHVFAKHNIQKREIWERLMEPLEGFVLTCIETNVVPVCR